MLHEILTTEFILSHPLLYSTQHNDDNFYYNHHQAPDSEPLPALPRPSNPTLPFARG